ncbi:hydroxyacylglutathione hydrolase-like protein isoform X4 [Mustela putorius furo]|uniref:Hydroxyacylglutathione hydrolase-like protein isoform X4 n=1 Tax=Mustela putorius furo TaxID=9669 RepID=A0A8U0NSR9_MUSPF|nr:hydroxyacylglutathione hydrolase-like protein isoform X4 [Mustela putorius furo]
MERPSPSLLSSRKVPCLAVGVRTPCLGLERGTPALRKGFGSLGAPRREDAGCQSSATMKVKVIPVLEDNYMYLVIEEHTREAVAVDVAVPKRLLEIVGREGVSLTTVLTTHYHWDHARGNAELARLRPGLAVLGADERICALTRKLVHGEELRFGAIHVRCLLTPGHTSGHMSYFLWEEECPDPPAVFSGDALSVAGCGLRLESTAQQMYESLTVTLGSLPPETKRDEDDLPTVPSTLSEELLYNPFLRVAEEPVRKFTGKAAPAEVLEALCKERASFQRAAEPLQPQARALLALQWGLLGTPRQK